ncbi:MAG TPA: LuxR family transcriptional regulator, partial [Dehalococcoidia bacterium]|nr:LuxR family transcriptional regulator [Dehalococcoidia bacterium]
MTVSDQRSTNLPALLTSFVGREREVVTVVDLLDRTRLATLTGVGGGGKTRLAIEVAGRLLDRYPDGAWLMELAPLADPALVPRAVAAALDLPEDPGRPPLAALAEALRSKRLLLVLDNCEHLIAACAALAEGLLLACPQLSVLATSREALNIAGEAAFHVPSLTVPDPRAGSLRDAIEGSEAARLFLDRATAARPGYGPIDADAPILAGVCRRLDGIPLALELAAARVKTLGLDQIADRLDDRFRLLTGGWRSALPRHQTLRAAIDWSYALLTDSERTLLDRLSVFAGGWTLEAAEAVGSDGAVRPADVLDLLAQLVDKSLVVAEARTGEVRYRLLETIRQYAAERLHAAGGEPAVRQRHATWYLRLAEEADPYLKGPDQARWMQRLEGEHDNFRAALLWSLGSTLGPLPAGETGGSRAPRLPDVGLRLAGALWWFWRLRGHLTEGSRWLAAALAAMPDRTTGRARALHGAGWLASVRGDLPQSCALMEEALTVAGDIGDRADEASCLQILAVAAHLRGDHATGVTLTDRALRSARRVGDPWRLGWALFRAGNHARFVDDDRAARSLFEESLVVRRAVGDRQGVALSLLLLSLVELDHGKRAPAREALRESLLISRELGDRLTILNVLAASAGLAAETRPDRALRLAGAVATLRAALGGSFLPGVEAPLERGIARARRVLDPVAAEDAWAAGEALSEDQAIAEALADEREDDTPGVAEAAVAGTPPAGASPARPDGLTPREVEVLRLIEACRGNR